ncbi:MAG: biopolymer transporter ExbD [Oscillatoria sp. PMC 1051.18]|uniref:ExbD/TolR family protein n=1 Tax=Oscillatoria salina TaxID=331517 RepID=UPI0013B9397E|nr:biopolymer transporter ExbD [Oscillatoria salina]MBZ8182628.1 biopolymer transporter ExbD [Oscillatoria salina IIICB1]MEC4895807.1 biopolymer transporter ExbD [Oscillatoria sp. PMC 1050.18]MEC5028390.1 biopolymer transporter ExbD [Oscillatoria sp. PMC 1051.18]NET88344.1 biopolymer transporter ExbD [Kamptonema sp. SIO1D9]
MTQVTSKKRKSRPNKAASTRPLRLWLDASNTEDVRIEIMPLIDVVFCILTFFILASVGFSRQQAISLDLPQAKTGTPQVREMLIVTIDDFGQIYVEKQPVANQNQLSQQIKSYYSANPSGQVVLYAAKKASYNEVMQVLDILREVGGDRVALATLPGNSSQPTESPDSLPTQTSPQLTPETNIPPLTPLPGSPPPVPGATNPLAPGSTTLPQNNNPLAPGSTTLPQNNNLLAPSNTNIDPLQGNFPITPKPQPTTVTPSGGE